MWFCFALPLFQLLAKMFQNSKVLSSDYSCRKEMLIFCNFLFTVWKFRNFSATQILREINCGANLDISKTEILAIFEVVNFDFGNFQA